jgi:aspartate aminotransferase-like enzyme
VVHPAAVKAQTYDLFPHRGKQITPFMLELYEKARFAHRTEGQVLIWAGSGSAGWEAGITNLLSPGDKVVATVSGAFGERFAQVGKTFGLDVHRVEVEWGQAVTPDVFEAALDAAGDVRAVFITHNETSTGVTNPLRELAALARARGAMILVDAVSSAAAMPLEVDEWELDWVFSGVQKAWMCPPGLMVAAVSERAIHASKSNALKRFYLDLAAMSEAAARGGTATTGALSLLYALDAALDAMLDEGMDAVWARHARLGQCFRDGLAGMGVQVLADPAYASSSVTAFRTPGGQTAEAFQEQIDARTGIAIATGQGPMATTVNRVGHMGWVNKPELEATLEAIRAATDPS